ncbi:BA14K family protein [Bartonella sp. A05]|uniref:BA14K family protein n=1 Tax=Bartonella sp. A05 TaxID=2967261 RepID=UPI0022A99518|nr:BA14K family protein [Bartonella sp. A05]MCZ2203537.1 BA14K family protein [Bartonella sp. A05]
MRTIRNLCYVLVVLSIGNIFMITTNLANSALKNGAETMVVHRSSIQEDRVPLMVTGRKEINGFKGYRHYRRGYRKYSDNWWYPEAAFVVFEDLDTKHDPLKATSTPKEALLISSFKRKEPWMFKEHIDSCVARYRSYNRNDNSYQPFDGPRKQCLSRVFKG